MCYTAATKGGDDNDDGAGSSDGYDPVRTLPRDGHRAGWLTGCGVMVMPTLVIMACVSYCMDWWFLLMLILT